MFPLHLNINFSLSEKLVDYAIDKLLGEGVYQPPTIYKCP